MSYIAKNTRKYCRTYSNNAIWSEIAQKSNHKKPQTLSGV